MHTMHRFLKNEKIIANVSCNAMYLGKTNKNEETCFLGQNKITIKTTIILGNNYQINVFGKLCIWEQKLSNKQSYVEYNILTTKCRQSKIMPTNYVLRQIITI